MTRRVGEAAPRNAGILTGPGKTRLSGVDAARGVALMGMMSVHVFRVAYPDSSAPAWMSEVVLGRSAALFAVLAGVGLALLSGGAHPRADRVRADRRNIMSRAGVIGAVGLTLGIIGSELEIILVHYAIMFLLALPLVAMSLGRLVILTAAWTLLAPVLALLAGTAVADMSWRTRLNSDPGWGSLAQPVTLMTDLFLTGSYPVLQWFGYVLFGMVIGRLGLALRRIQLLLVAGGASLFLLPRFLSMLLLGSAGRPTACTGAIGMCISGVSGTSSFQHDDMWWWLATDTPHSGTTLALTGTMGTSALVLGLCLLLCRRRTHLLLPLEGPGAMTFTLYSAHIITMVFIMNWYPYYDATSVFWWQAGAAVAIGSVFLLTHRRGPLEALANRAAAAARSG